MGRGWEVLGIVGDVLSRDSTSSADAEWQWMEMSGCRDWRDRPRRVGQRRLGYSLGGAMGWDGVLEFLAQELFARSCGVLGGEQMYNEDLYE